MKWIRGQIVCDQIAWIDRCVSILVAFLMKRMYIIEKGMCRHIDSGVQASFELRKHASQQTENQKKKKNIYVRSQFNGSVASKRQCVGIWAVASI